MTVRLLKPYAQRPVGAIATFDASTEAGMIEAKQASADLTGGFEYFLPRPGLKLQVPQIAVGSLTLRPAEQAPAVLPEGQVLNVSGIAGTVGKVYRLDPTGGNTPLQSWVVGPGALAPIGAYAGEQRFLVTCSTGSIRVDAGLAAASAPQPVLDASGGLAALSTGVKRVGLRKTARRIMSRAQSGRCKAIALNDALFAGWAPMANTAGLSLYNRIALAADAEAVRILIPNMHTAAVSGVRVGLGLTANLGSWSGTPPAGAGSAAQTSTAPVRTEAVNSAGGDLLAATWSSAASGTLPAAYDAANLVANYTATDWMPIATVARTDGSATPFPLLDVVVEYPAGSIATLAFDGNAYSQPSSFGNEALYEGRVWRAWAQDVLGVTTPAAFTRRDISGYYIPLIVQYRSRNTGAVCEMSIGDSIYDGTGAALPLNSFARRAMAAESTAVAPIEYCNLSVPGATSAMLAARAQYLMPLVKPGIFHFEWGTVNNISGATMSARQIQHALGAFGVMMALADQYDAVPLTNSFLPVSAAAKSLGATDSIRSSMNSAIAARVAADPTSFHFCDLGPTFDDPAQVAGQTVPKAALMAPDGIHPGESGHAAAGVDHQAALHRAMQWA